MSAKASPTKNNNADKGDGAPEIKIELSKEKKTYNPYKIFKEYKARKRLELEIRMSKREEQMYQDFECYLMNIEDRDSWLGYELNTRNYQRMLREQKASALQKKILKKEMADQEIKELETGISYFRGSVQENRKWQNSAAKILDLKAHSGPITSCKMSKDLRFMLTCSADKTAMLWNMKSGKMLRTFTGHTRRVTDGDFHPTMFNLDNSLPCLVTCSVDTTIRLWNGVSERPLKSLNGHAEVVYKVSFSPDGQKLVSCSEDLTIRTWSFPEGYQTFVYRQHMSPVVTVRFSPSGRYLVSGSDYGERKIFLWDASLPRIETSVQFPHMIYWNRDGLIGKILLRQTTPLPEFWLTQDEVQLLPSDTILQMWPGELANDIVESDSESDQGESDEDEEDVGLYDEREVDDVVISVSYVDMETKQHKLASEYIPGYFLIITVQSLELPVIDAFVSVNRQESHYDVFKANSGERVGEFDIHDDIPLRPVEIAKRKAAKRALLQARRDDALAKAIEEGTEEDYIEEASEEEDDDEFERRDAPEGLDGPESGEHIRYINKENYSIGRKMMERALAIRRGDIVEEEPVLPEDEDVENNEENNSEAGEGNELDAIEEGEEDSVEDDQDGSDGESNEEPPAEAVGSSRLSGKLGSFFNSVKLGSSGKDTPGAEEGNDVSGAKRSHENIDKHAMQMAISNTKAKEAEAKSKLTTVQCVWHCPEPDKGAVVVTANVTVIPSVKPQPLDLSDGKKKKKKPPLLVPKRIRLTYSLSESTTRVNSKRAEKRAREAAALAARKRGINLMGQLKATAPRKIQEPVYMFDQELRHKIFCRFIAEQQWDSVEAMLDPKCVMYHESEMMTRPWRAVNRLEELFGDSASMIFQSPFIFRAGVTRSSFIMEACEVGEVIAEQKVVKPKEDLYDSELEDEEESDEEEGSGVANNEAVENHSSHSVEADAVEELPDADGDSQAPEKVDAHADAAGVAIVTDISLGDMTAGTNESRSASPGIMKSHSHDHKHHAMLAQHRSLALLGRQKAKPMNLPTEIPIDPSVLSIEDKLLLEIKMNGGLTPSEIAAGIPAKNPNGSAPGSTKVSTKSNTCEYTLVKNSLFGPQEILRFTMPLPEYFPVNAGECKKAFKYQLDKHKVVMERIRRAALPSALEGLDQADEVDNADIELEIIDEDVEEADSDDDRPATAASGSRPGTSGQSRKASSKDTAALVSELVQYYGGGRRPASVQIPGMVPHYPNPNYDNPTPLVGFDKPEAKGSAFSSIMNLFTSSTGAIGNLVPVVGRKLPSASVSLEETHHSDPEHSHHRKNIKHEDSTTSLENSEASEKNSNARVSAKLRKSGKEVEQAVEKSLDENSVESLEHSKSSTDVVAVEAVAPSLMQRLSGKSKKVPKSLSLKQKKKAEEEQIQDYLESYLANRRGSFPVAPGLDSFASAPVVKKQEAVAVAPKSVDALYDKNRIGALSVRERAELLRKTGLIRCCSINDFEIVHHGSINDVAFSPSEKRLVSAGGDGVIKMWDPRDGTYIRQFETYNYEIGMVGGLGAGVEGGIPKKFSGGEVLAVAYTQDELYLVSAGSDAIILIWDLTTCCVTRALKGHADIISCIAITHDCNQLISGSYDGIVKTWFLTPRHPDPPAPPRVISRTDRTMLITWQSPPSYNEHLTAFHLQYRVGNNRTWKPEVAISMPPYFRSRAMNNLSAATPYQFRLRAENKMGVSEWGTPSRQEFTAMGLPAQVDRPLAIGLSKHMVTICWFAANPNCYGSASRLFYINCSGEGKSYDDYPTTEVKLDEAARRGAQYLEQVKNEVAEADDSLLHFHVSKHKHSDDEDEGSLNGEEGEGKSGVVLSLETKKALLERAKDDTEILVVADIADLHPGCMYRFTVKACNTAGVGLASLESYSVSTLPARPLKPGQPTKKSSTLDSITFSWHAPNDGGSAITGYRLFVKHMDRHVDLNRSAVKYTLRGLLPGKQYYVRVLAKNAVGMSPYSEYNDDANSYTSTSKPDAPEKVVAVAATWNSLTISALLPPCNGSDISHILLQYREIQPFSKGNWTRAIEYKIPEDVVITEPKEEEKEVDIFSDVDEGPIGKIEEAGAPKKRVGIQMTKKKVVGKNKGTSLIPVEASVKLDSSVGADDGMSDILKSAGPKATAPDEAPIPVFPKVKGPRIEVVVSNLVPATPHEFRYACRNKSGLSDFSNPSQRALTNRAVIPPEPKVPVVTEVVPMLSSVVLYLDSTQSIGTGKKLVVIGSGGKKKKKQNQHPVLYVHFEAKEASMNASKTVKFNNSAENKYTIESLTPGVLYQFRCRLENDIGAGPYSQWSVEVRMPAI